MRKLVAYLFLFLCVTMVGAQNKGVSNKKRSTPEVGVVFSGGGALGLAHIGAIKALEEAGIEPKYVAGTSMGAIIGVMYAAGYSADEIMEIVKDRRLYKVGHLMTWRSALRSNGMSSQKTLLRELSEFIPYNSFDSLERKFMVCVTNVETAEPVYRSKGDNLREFVAASASIPAVFESIVIDEVRYVDGGMMDNLPVKALRAEFGKPKMKVIAIDVLPFIENFEAKNFLDMAKWTLRVFQHKNAEPNRASADCLIDCWALKKYHEFDFKYYKEIYQYGYDAMKEKLQNIDKADF